MGCEGDWHHPDAHRQLQLPPETHPERKNLWRTENWRSVENPSQEDTRERIERKV